MYIYTNHIYVCIYHVLQSHTHLGGSLLDSLQFSLSRQQNRTPYSRCSLMGARQRGINISFGPLTTFLPTKTRRWLVVSSQRHIPVSCSGCCPPEPPDCRPAALPVSPQPVVLDGIIPSQEGFCVCLPLLYTTGKSFNEDFLLNLPIFFL